MSKNREINETEIKQPAVLAPEEIVQTTQTVEEFLDQIEQDRLEWERVEEDMFPGTSPETRARRVHSSDDPVQRWLAAQRQN